MIVPLAAPAAPPRPVQPREPDALSLALDRATGARPTDGNLVRHEASSARALEAMLALVGRAARWVHVENYIIRDDRFGRRFAHALAARAAEGVAVRVLYDAFGSWRTSRRYWRALVNAGVDVRPFQPLASRHVLDVFARDHRKLAVADGVEAMIGGACIGDEWAGVPAQSRQPWRDTMVTIAGPAAAAADRAFARLWERAGPPLPPDELEADPVSRGAERVRVIAGTPGRARVYRAVQLLVASARDRFWLTDAYLLAPALLYASLLDAARAGVDVRLLVPGTSDLPVLRDFTRGGYRELLRAGARIFEWQGPMLHAKTLLVDHRWARVGSSNLNVSSLLGNYELDVLVESGDLSAELTRQFLHDLASSREIVLHPRRRFLPARLLGAPTPAGDRPAVATPHKRSGRELGAVTLVALRRVGGGLRRAVAASAALLLVALGALLLAFPRLMSIVLAAGALLTAGGVSWYAIERHRAQEPEDGG